MKREIWVKDIQTDEIVQTIETTDAKFERVLSGLMRKVDPERFYVDYRVEED